MWIFSILPLLLAVSAYAQEPPHADDSHSVDKRTVTLSEVVRIKNKRRNDFMCENEHMTKSLRTLFLNAQNDARQSIAKGFEGSGKGLLPKASNMYKLRWSCDLEQRAQEWVNKCEYMEAFHVRREAQNYELIDDVKKDEDLTPHVVKTLIKWRKQITTANIEDEIYYNTALGISDWANMVHAATTQVGCAIQRCGDKLALTCFYDKAGDVPDQQIYLPGAPCQMDFQCTKYEGSHCIPGEGLCFFNEDEYDAFEMERTSRICPNTPHMNDAARSTIIDWHNSFRSSLARGLEADGKGGYAPMASKMLKMFYDCALERSAQEAVDRCEFKASRNGKGENMYVTQIETSRHDQVSILQEAALNWWSELKNEGVGTNNTFTPRMVIYRQMAYSQMAWGTTFRLGCATKACSGKYYAVCHYSPNGNSIQKPIYARGYPCTDDEGCDRGQECAKDEGLCMVVVD